jgi:hypothetical protein
LDCPQSSQYTSRAGTAEGLDSIGKEALDDIQATFQCGVEYGIPTSELNEARYRVTFQDAARLLIRNPRTGVGRYIDGTKRIYILNDDEWLVNQVLTIGPTYLGTYTYNAAVVLVHSSTHLPVSWCKNILVHETLHSVSLYSRIWNNPPDIIPKHKMLIEGMTECLTGYILFKRHLGCYDVWKSSIQGKCEVAYRPTTRLFCSLAQLIGIKPIADFYLSVAREFNAPWNQFTTAIHSAGFTKFRFSLSQQTAFREALFREECIKSIAGFKKIYDSDAKALDFAQIR